MSRAPLPKTQESAPARREPGLRSATDLPTSSTSRSNGTPVQPRSRGRRLARWLAQRVAVLMALLILFYATSLHGISSRTLILAIILIVCLYWLFKDAF